MGVNATLTFPQLFPPWSTARRGLRRLGLDTEAFFSSYPFHIRSNGADVIHLTTQTMGALLLAQRFDRPVVVTVLDIIPYLVRHDPKLNTFRNPVDSLFYRLALVGLRRADAIIAISQWTKQTLVSVLGLAPDKINVIYPGVDHKLFRPMAIPDTFLEKFGLDRKTQYVLYVGSDDPRKNLPTLIEAFARAKRPGDKMALLKVGPIQFPRNSARLAAQIERLGLQTDILTFDDISDEDLPLFYNLAVVCVIPSQYEGFGLPALEAMACGVPLICARIDALVEIVGNAGVYFDPGLAQQLAEELRNMPVDREARLKLSEARYQRASAFGWARCARETKHVYAEMGASS